MAVHPVPVENRTTPDLHVVPVGRSKLRRDLNRVLNVGMTIAVHVGAALKADTLADAADDEHDRLLDDVERHHQAAYICLRDGNAIGVARHIRLANQCVKQAKQHNAIDGQHRDRIADLLKQIRSCIRLANSLLDRWLGVPK